VYTFVLMMMMMMMMMTPFKFVNDENAGMHFGNELCNGNTSTAVEKYQWQFKADKCLLLATGGYGKQT